MNALPVRVAATEGPYDASGARIAKLIGVVRGRSPCGAGPGPELRFAQGPTGSRYGSSGGYGFPQLGLAARAAH